MKRVVLVSLLFGGCCGWHPPAITKPKYVSSNREMLSAENRNDDDYRRNGFALDDFAVDFQFQLYLNEPDNEWKMRDEDHFKFSELHHLAPMPEGIMMKIKPDSTNGDYIDDYRLTEDRRVQSPNGVVTTCRIDETIYKYSGFDYESNENKEGLRHCIFPSGTLEHHTSEDGYYAAPYAGKLECANSIAYGEFFEQNGKCFCDYYEYWESYSRGYHGDKGYLELKPCFFPKGRCLFNPFHETIPKPWRGLPQSPKDENILVHHAAANYLHNSYMSHVDDFCYFAACDPVVYLEISLPDRHNAKTSLEYRFNGFYVIDHNVDHSSKNIRMAGAGFPRYRHVKYQRWVSIRTFDLKVSTSGIVAPPGRMKRIAVLEEMDFTTGVIAPVIEKDLSFRWDGDFEKQWNFLRNQDQPDSKGHFCMNEMEEFTKDVAGDSQWRWAKGTMWKDRDGKLASGTLNWADAIKFAPKSKGKPLRPPCGVNYRPSENYSLNAGRQPWVVQLLIGSKRAKHAAKCTGTVLSPRHVLTAASCLCSQSNKHNIFHTDDNRFCAVKRTNKMHKLDFHHHRNGKPLKVWIYIPGMSAQGAKYSENVHDVIWVTFHRSYTRTQREYDVAILGTRWTLQFSPSLLPVCLMDSRYSDSNTFPHGVMLYSTKALKSSNAELDKGKFLPFTNANGHSIYEQCETPCTKDESLLEFVIKLEKTIRKYRGHDFSRAYSFPPWCRYFYEDYRNNLEALLMKFQKGWWEPQAKIRLILDKFGLALDKAVHNCFDLRASSYRFGWCKTRPNKLPNNQTIYTSWGFCDDSKEVTTSTAKYYEVETTLVPEDECEEKDQKDVELSERVLTKICTKYIPHLPSIYEFKVEEEFGTVHDYKLLRYLGGYYRDFIPKLNRRKIAVRKDKHGNFELDPWNPEYHSGFPSAHQICHEDDMDVGAPTTMRLARVPFYNDRTFDTTEEQEEAGVSVNVLVSIQTGWTNDGKVCNALDGDYADVETLITADILNFIRDEIGDLSKFDKILNIDDYLINTKGQIPTPSPIFTTTPTTTTPVPDEDSILDSKKYLIDPSEFPKFDYAKYNAPTFEECLKDEACRRENLDF